MKVQLISLVTRWLKNFSSGCKNINDQAKTGRVKTMNSEVVLQDVEANLVNLAFPNSSVVCVKELNKRKNLYGKVCRMNGTSKKEKRNMATLTSQFKIKHSLEQGEFVRVGRVASLSEGVTFVGRQIE